MERPSSRFTCKVIGQGAMLADCCRILADRGHAVCGVVASGPVALKFARKADIEVVRDDEDYVRFLARSQFDYLFSVVHLTKIPAEALRLPKALSINFHDSLLPRYALTFKEARLMPAHDNASLTVLPVPEPASRRT